MTKTLANFRPDFKNGLPCGTCRGKGLLRRYLEDVACPTCSGTGLKQKEIPALGEDEDTVKVFRGDLLNGKPCEMCGGQGEVTAVTEEQSRQLSCPFCDGRGLA